MAILRTVIGTLSAFVMALGVGVGSAQEYPNKPVRLITSAAGGGSDFISRQISGWLTPVFGQTFVVDNRPGTVLPIEAVAKSPPDGYSLLVQGSSVWVFPLLQSAPYHPINDFAPIALVVREINMLAVHPSLPVKSVKDLVALAKARPGQLNSGATGGGMQHLGTELFKSMSGADIAFIPYKSVSNVLTAVVSGELQVVILDGAFLMPHVKAGKLKGIAITSGTPSALFPGMSTISDSGLPGYDIVGRTGFYAPINTPAAIVNRLNQEVVRAVNRPDVKEKLLAAGVDPVGSTAAEFAAMIKSEYARLGKVVTDGKLRIN